MNKKIDLSNAINKITKKVNSETKQVKRKLPEIPPDTFEHQKQVDQEFATMKFTPVKFKLFPEDEIKLQAMSKEEKTVFMEKIRNEHRYTVIKDNTDV